MTVSTVITVLVSIAGLAVAVFATRRVIYRAVDRMLDWMGNGK